MLPTCRAALGSMVWEYWPPFQKILRRLVEGSGAEGTFEGSGWGGRRRVFFLPEWVQQRFVEQNPAVVVVLVIKFYLRCLRFSSSTVSSLCSCSTETDPHSAHCAENRRDPIGAVHGDPRRSHLKIWTTSPSPLYLAVGRPGCVSLRLRIIHVKVKSDPG